MTKSKRPSSRTSDSFAGIRKRVAAKLTGFASDFPADLDAYGMDAHRPHGTKFPVPELVLFMLRDVMGWNWQGRGEKVRWSVFGSFNGEPIGFELRKFGFAILTKEGAKLDTKRIEGQLGRALKEVEKYLQPLAEHYVEQGEVTIANRFHEFDSRYRFFRMLADKSYKTASKAPRRSSATKSIQKFSLGLADFLNHETSNTRNAFFHSTAMVDSYFSLLEHRLVLLRAFGGKPVLSGELKMLLSSKWDAKLAGVVTVAGNRPIELILGKMRRIKERIRNPFAHGGVETDGGSLFFHLPNIGAIPANFSRFGDSVRYSFIPIQADDHAETCGIFDELDKLLSSGTLAGPHRLMEAGVDPAFDSNSLKEYSVAISSGDAVLEAFLDQWGSEWDRHANMDY